MIGKVYIEQLRLENFRNYESLRQDIDHRYVILTGENGSGKTNLIEAISLLSPGRGIRRGVYTDISRDKGDGSFSIFAKLKGMCGDVSIGTGIAPNETGSRRIRINAEGVKSNGELLKHTRILWLTPSMDWLFTGGAGDRRRFLDRLILSINPSHGKYSLSYERAMRSRNKLLSEGGTDSVWLDGIEQQMAQLGIAISSSRHEYINMLTGLIEVNSDEELFPKAILKLDGFDIGFGNVPAVDKEEMFIENLRQMRARDISAGRSLTGPHKMDMTACHAKKNMLAASCSTGEQKALLVGIFLAHAHLVQNLTGYSPIILLDEITAHLDEQRRTVLFNLIDRLDCQVFMTGTDRSMFDILSDRAQYFNVSNGHLMKV